MSDWKLKDNGDWDIVNNGVPLVDGAQEVKQIIREALRTFLGEYFLDLSIGLPYFQTIFQKGVPQEIIETIFKNEILACAGVISLQAFRLTLNGQTREAQLDFTVLTTNGPVTLTETI